MKYLFILAIIFTASPALAAKCNIKAVMDKEDGAVYYDKEHRLYKHVKINNKNGDQTFCSKREAERAGFEEAPENFSNSTARLVECIEDGVKSCMGYVIGQYQSLKIYDRACGNDDHNKIVSSFLEHAKKDSNRMDVEKFYGTTGALMDAYPCGGRKVAGK